MISFERFSKSFNTAVAIAVSVVFLLLPPVGYAFVSYLNIVATMDREIGLLGLGINRVISNVPQLWTFQTDRYRDLLERGQRGFEPSKLTIFDDKGNQVTTFGDEPAWPVVTREIPLFDAGTTVGRLQNRRSLRGLGLNLGLLLALGIALASVAFVTLRVVPLRALQKMNATLRQRDTQISFANAVNTAAMEGAPDGMLIVDQNGRIIMNNQRFFEMWNVPLALAEAHDDAPVLRLVASQVKNPDAFLARVIYLYDHPDEPSHDRIELKDGRIFDRHTAALIDADRKYLGRIWFFRDMTEREALERAVRTSEEKFRSLVETTPDVIWEIDAATRFVYVSPAISELTGYEPEEVIGKSMFDFMSPDETARFAAEIAPFTAARRPFVALENIIRRKDGSEIVFEAGAVPIFDVAGTYVGYRGVNRDITQRKLAAQALAKRDALLHATTLGATELASASSSSDVMTNVLKHVGETIQVDRINVIERPQKPGERPVCQSNWNGAGASPRMDIQVIPMDAVEAKDWFAQLSKGQTVAVDARTITGAPRKVLDDLDVKTRLMVPVITNNEWWGHVSFDSCKAERRWEAFEIEQLRTFTELIGNAIRRDRYVAQLRDTMRIVQNTPTILYRVSTTPAMVLSYVSQNIKLFGYEPEQLISLPDPLKTFIHPDDLPKVLERLTGTLEAGNEKGIIEHRVLTGSGDYRSVENRYTAVRDASGRLIEIEGIMVDITERRAAEAQIALLARTDGLTGLANRNTFGEHLRFAFAAARRGAPAFAVLYLDLDRFKDVNDTLGHPVGDLLLKTVAERLKGSTRETDLVARPGGDEFAILQSDLNDVADAGALATNIRTALAEPILLNGNELHITASVGIAIYTPEIAAPDDMLTRADLALYRAKQEGRDQYRFHSDELDEQVRNQVAIADGLKEALDRREFEIYYQPQVERSSGRIMGMEALLRWNHPTKGQLKPLDFLPIAEKTGTIAAIGKWVLDTACGQMSAWRKAGIVLPTVAVNVSLAQIKTANEFLQTVTSTLAKWGLAGKDLELDVTESMLAYTTLANNDVLERLQRLGVKIAIDDFGTKFSSLDYLRSYRVSRIKIPKSMMEAAQFPGDGAMVRAITSIARELNVEVIAQGVETEAQWSSLTAMSPAANVQGYFYSKPVPAGRAVELLRQGVIGRPADLAADF